MGHVTAQPGSLSGKVALVTGSSRGIGRATVLELASRGADVIVNYFRHRMDGEAAADSARAHGVRAVAVRAHLGKATEIDALFEAANGFGGVDILVCNAASSVFRPLLQVDDQGWNWTMDISLRSALLCAQRAAPHMEARHWGRIVTVGSAWTTRVQPNYGMVGIAKGGLDALTRYLAVELAPSGIVVNAVAPGPTSTEAWETYQQATGRNLEQDVVAHTPLGRLVTPEQIAQVVAFLCQVEGIVGQTVTVDNGLSIAN